MKKVLVVIVLAVMLVSLCACSYVPADRFMSRSQVNSLAKKYDAPQAEVTLNYEVGGKKVEVQIVYDLLLKQTPIAVIRFIQLANSGFYNESVVDNYNSTYKYLIMGRYSYKDSAKVEEGKDPEKKYFANTSDTTFIGEFKSNGYKEPKEGYADFSMFSLAMFHEQSEDDTYFNTANGTLILALRNQALSADNYAVFAHPVQITVKYGDGKPTVHTDGRIPSIILANLTSFTSKITRTVYQDATEASSNSVSIMATRVMLTVNMLGDYDWSKLPQVGR